MDRKGCSLFVPALSTATNLLILSAWLYNWLQLCPPIFLAYFWLPRWCVISTSKKFVIFCFRNLWDWKIFQSCFIWILFFSFCFLPFSSHILENIRLFNVIKIAVNLFMQWKECLTNGQMLARSDYYILFHNLHWILFWPDVCKHFVHITFIPFFLQMIQQSTVVVRFSIFFQGFINIPGMSGV